MHNNDRPIGWYIFSRKLMKLDNGWQKLIARNGITKNKLKTKKIVKSISIREDGLQIQEVKFRKQMDEIES
jgi:hypothetical protein